MNTYEDLTRRAVFLEVGVHIFYNSNLQKWAYIWNHGYLKAYSTLDEAVTAVRQDKKEQERNAVRMTTINFGLHCTKCHLKSSGEIVRTISLVCDECLIKEPEPERYSSEFTEVFGDLL